MPAGPGYLTDVVGGRDFNRILLRHGYHWKDPGAQGVTHGEYTHRIQWYALLTKWAALGLVNKPLLVFKAMVPITICRRAGSRKNQQWI